MTTGAEALVVELAVCEGEPLRLEWDEALLRALGSGSDALGDQAPAPWSASAIDWQDVELVRALSLAFDDGTLLALATARPADAQGHGEEAARAVLMRPGGEPRALAEALLSTEYGPDRAVRRIGAELYGEPEGYPSRLAGDPIGGFRSAGDGAEREVTVVEARLDGEAGVGLYELLRRA